jgi:hypothetical protein
MHALDRTQVEYMMVLAGCRGMFHQGHVSSGACIRIEAAQLPSVDAYRWHLQVAPEG